ncbi:kunitz-type trypsin inhibitor-like 1 protein [Prosopis cineraria]|uniref:kunitz-type trypsin inhibitor-like 1 protein n=1 Tax=Prosopis cineraria TaxID=364024 RepID=UPI0024108112|nr:kunitz-type trypsin inhibitor-like 1 protein [Prosopis cineraria]
MKIALLALFFLLFAFSTQYLTLAAEEVLDTDGNALVPGKSYYIVNASDHNRGIETELIDGQTCPISVIFGLDAKKVNFITKNPDATSIKTGVDVYINFTQVSPCAKSANWTVAVNGSKVYPVLIGPPNGVTTIEGEFRIKKSKTSGVYNIVFHLFGTDNYYFGTKPSGLNEDIYLLELCEEEGFDVQFIAYETPTLTSTYEPRIRKRVA